MGTAGGAGRLSDIDFSVDHIWEGEVRDGSRECEGDVKDDVRGRAVAGEVKEEERDLLPVVGREEGEGERGEVKENCGADLFAGGENRLSGGTFVLETERRGKKEECRKGGREERGEGVKEKGMRCRRGEGEGGSKGERAGMEL